MPVKPRGPGRLKTCPPRVGWTCALAAALLCLGGPGWTQEVRFEAEVDRDSLRADEVLYLTVALNVTGSAQTGEPELDRTDDFDLMGAPERQDGYQLSGTQIARYTQRVFALRPRRGGNLSVPRARVTVGGREYQTAALRVHVGRGTTPTSSAAGGQTTPPVSTTAPGQPFTGTPEFVVRCRTDRSRVAVNQQLTVTLDYYSAYRLQRTPGQAGPKAEGFVSEDLPDPDPGDVTINGRDYAHYSNVWALFATAAGTYKVSAPTEKLMLPPLYQEQSFASNVVKVTVKPLPTVGGKAPAVGRFTVSLSADKPRVKVGESLLARVVVEGSGNLRAVPAPALRASPGCRVWESARRRQPEARGDGANPLAGGQAVFEYVVMPSQAGPLSLGPVQLATYDPEHGTTGNVRSATVTVQVLPGANGAIRLQEPASLAAEAGATAAQRGLVIPLWLISVLAGLLAGGAILGLVWQGQRRRQAGQQARQSGAAKAARARIRQARGGGAGEREGLVAEALSQYVADRCALPGPTALPAEVAGALVACGAPRDLAEQLSGLIAAGREARFAPQAARVMDPAQMARAAEDLIGRCEQTLREGGAATSAAKG